MSGYIKLYKQILDNIIVCKDSDYLAIFIYLLIKSDHLDYDVIFKNEKISVKKGSLITSRKSIAMQFNISESKVQRVLKRLENEQHIEQQTSSEKRLIILRNSDLYNSSEQQSEQQVNNKRTTSEQQVNNKRTTSEQQVNTAKTNKDYNKTNKDYINNIYTSFFEEIWKQYPTRHNQKVGKYKSFMLYKQKIKEQDRALFLQAVKNYASSDLAKNNYAKDCERFIKNEFWRDFIKKEEEKEDSYSKLMRERLEQKIKRSLENEQNR